MAPPKAGKRQFDESKVNRGAKGTSEGGQFTSGGGGTPTQDEEQPQEQPQQQPEQPPPQQPQGTSPDQSGIDKSDAPSNQVTMSDDEWMKASTMDEGTLKHYDGPKTPEAAQKWAADTQRTDDVIKGLVKDSKAAGLGYWRHDMPQITTEYTQDFFDFLKKKYNAPVHNEKWKAGNLKASQREIFATKTQGMVFTMETKGADFLDKFSSPPMASSDGYILDGHHRWAAKYIVDPNSEMEVVQVDMPIQDLLDAAHQYDNVGYAGLKHHGPVDSPEVKPGKPQLHPGKSVDAATAARYGGVSPDIVGSLSGHADNATLTMQVKDGAHPVVQYNAMGPVDESGISSYQAQHTLQTDSQGGKWLRNDNIIISPKHQKQGLATQMMARQIVAAQQGGLQGMSLYAGGRPGDPSGMAGYQVWPKMGYDAVLPEHLKRKLPTELQFANTIQDLHGKRSGREWWAANGEALEMRFDITEGSISRRAFDKYMRRRVAAERLPAKFRKERYYAAAGNGDGGFDPDIDESDLDDLEKVWEEIEKELEEERRGGQQQAQQSQGGQQAPQHPQQRKYSMSAEVIASSPVPILAMIQQARYAKSFDESKVNRDEGGQFAEKEGESSDKPKELKEMLSGILGPQ